MGQSKRILIIEDDSDYQELLKAALTTFDEAFETIVAASLSAAISEITQSAPDAILVDLHLPDSSGYETFLRVRKCSDRIPIIILTGQDLGGLVERAVEDGAEEYLVKSLVQPELIARCVQVALTRRARTAGGAPTEGNVLAFIGSKGGVGTTTTALNVATLLAQHGNTGFIEYGAWQGILPLCAANEHDRRALALQRLDEIATGQVGRHFAEYLRGLEVLCAALPSFPRDPATAGRVQAVIGASRQVFSHVVLDLPARVDEGVMAALQSSDAIALLVDREASSLHAGSTLMRQMLAASLPAEKIHLIIVERTAGSETVSREAIRQHFGVEPVMILPSATDVIALSWSTYSPVVLLYPGGWFSLTLMELVERLATAMRISTASDFRKWIEQALGWRPAPETFYG